MSEALNYGQTGTRGSIAKAGGALGVAGTMIGLAIFVAACMGFGAAFSLALIPLILGSTGLILTIVGAVLQKDKLGIEDTHVLASILTNVGVIAGALLEVAMWKGIPIFAVAGA